MSLYKPKEERYHMLNARIMSNECLQRGIWWTSWILGTCKKYFTCNTESLLCFSHVIPCPEIVSRKLDAARLHNFDKCSLIHKIGTVCPGTGSWMHVVFLLSNTDVILDNNDPLVSPNTFRLSPTVR